jgi:hypothetical protein
MELSIKKTSLALAIAGLIGSPLALAVDKEVTVTENIEFNNEIDVEIEKELKTTKDVRIKGRADIEAERAAVATVEDKQLNFENEGVNFGLENTVTLHKSVTDNEGSTQVNAAAGDNNQQDNAAAIAADTKALGLAEAEVFVLQHDEENSTSNLFTINEASIRDSLNDNEGSLQANIAVGNNNQQKNNLALAVADDAALAEATVAVIQESNSNSTGNTVHFNTATLRDSMNDNFGSVQVNIAAGTGNQQVNSLAVATK